MPGFDKQYPPSLLYWPEKSAAQILPNWVLAESHCLFQFSKVFSFWTHYIFHQLSYRFLGGFFNRDAFHHSILSPNIVSLGKMHPTALKSLFNTISKAAACSVYFLSINSSFDWYISITNLFTEIMIDWSGKEIEHLTVAKESFYQSKSKIKHKSFITILWYVI